MSKYDYWRIRSLEKSVQGSVCNGLDQPPGEPIGLEPVAHAFAKATI